MAEWRGSVSNIAITAAGTSDTLVAIPIQQGAENLWIEVENLNHKGLDAFITQVRPHPDAAWHTVAQAASDYSVASDITEPIVGCSGDLTTLAKGTTGLLWMYVKGLHAVRFQASAASGSDTLMNAKWQVR